MLILARQCRALYGHVIKSATQQNTMDTWVVFATNVRDRSGHKSNGKTDNRGIRTATLALHITVRLLWITSQHVDLVQQRIVWNLFLWASRPGGSAEELNTFPSSHRQVWICGGRHCYFSHDQQT